MRTVGNNVARAVPLTVMGKLSNTRFGELMDHKCLL